jgi:NADH-quinone oxidoreductase subunit L
MLSIVILSPLLGALLNGLLLPKNNKALSYAVGVAAMLGAFVAAAMLFAQFIGTGGNPSFTYAYEWLHAGNLRVPMEFVVDRLSALLLLIVTGIGLLIHIYAGGYMAEEKNTYRFFAYLNLFIFMMLLLILGNNLLVMFVGWEGVGLCSYLLIGYWYSDMDNAKAGMKAFLTNRVGDFAFLLGIFATYKLFGTLSFSELKNIIAGYTSLDPHQLQQITLITFCFFVGACGKSAQLPLYIWLPDAMAGPTPVSALIHAATMVTAGIYMMARLNFLFYLAPLTMEVVAWVGVATALFAATIATVQWDIKKVLAYSTISQLGYMVLACGVGAFDGAVFHLLTHACFKALLFLGAGSVIVAMHHEQDMRKMGGLWRYLPITHALMVIGVLAIIGFPGLAGFFSKDEILWKTFLMPGTGRYLWAVAAVTALLTSYYMVRLLCLTFYGKSRIAHHTQSHLHETPVRMWGPLVVLALLSIGVGYLGVPESLSFGGFPAHIFADYLEPIFFIPADAQPTWAFASEHQSHFWEVMLMGFSVALVLLGSTIALFSFGFSKQPNLGSWHAPLQGAYRMLSHKYWVDEIYGKLIYAPLRDIAEFLWKVFDVKVINGVVNGLGYLFMGISGFASFKMTGSIHRHGMFMLMGMVVLLLWLM